MNQIVKKYRFEDIWYLLAFLVISVAIIIPFFQYGKIFAVSDWSFHASRVEQIYRNLKEGHLFTFIATSTFNHTGVGSFMFYPTLFLYPWVFLRFIFNQIDSFYIWYGLITLIAFGVSYFSMKRYSKNSQLSFIFSIVYVLNNYRLYLGHSVFGEFIAASFLPLVFLGFYQVFLLKKVKKVGLI